MAVYVPDAVVVFGQFHLRSDTDSLDFLRILYAQSLISVRIFWPQCYAT